MGSKKKWAAFLIAVGSLTAASYADAFSDILDPNQDQIATYLQTKGIIHGVSEDKFAPSDSLTAAQGIQMLVNAMNLQAKHKSSSVSSGHEAPKAWYAEAAGIAADNGLTVESIRDWNMKLTREQFAGLLEQALSAAGISPVAHKSAAVADESQIAPEYRNAVQSLLLAQIAATDEQDRFQPKRYITRMEAAEMTYNAIKYYHGSDDGQGSESQDDDVSVQVEKVNDQVNKIVLFKSDMPNPGYGIMIDRIEFLPGQKAIAYYHFTTPKPGTMYPQVISTAKASFYVDSQFKVSVKKSSGPDGSQISIPGINPINSK
ncbi:protease complex subunit PrcB family protein [Paenibacillus azoreducens]|uniref:SLH domain-containing protein n=1 Tax=Paenibacillus azoreducens TaxID=116718 RepID=A0A919YG48_9BACL|nr:protease complex subunit PrcB family protein [Paenibacillus azoreducens]GIO49844.1 hypothetical protein J34TS1_46090 [Paenibacillus azoreducens]